MDIARLFYFLAGTSELAIRDCPQSERNYHAAIGGFVLITGTAAALSGGYALYTVFGSIPASMLFGIFWGLTIGAVDRFIVMTLDITMHTSRLKGFAAAAGRLVIAFFVAFVIARPLELRIFAPEINARLQGEILAALDENVAETESELARRQSAHEGNTRLISQEARLESLTAEHTGCLAEQAVLMEAVHGECDGTSGTQRAGLGPVCRLKQRDLETVRARCDGLGVQRIELEGQVTALADDMDQTRSTMRSGAEAHIASLEARAHQRVAAIEAGQEGSLLTRLDALHNLSNETWGLWYAVWFITALFVLVEAMPVGLKLMVAGHGTYPKRLDHDDKENAGRHSVERELREEHRGKQQAVMNEVIDAVREQQRQRILAAIEAGDDVVVNDVYLELRRRTEITSQDTAEERDLYDADLHDDDPRNKGDHNGLSGLGTHRDHRGPAPR